MKPGLYPDLDRADLPAGLSYSGAKDILKNPALYQRKRRNPQPPTAAMEQGTVTHSLTLGTPQTWRTIAGGRGVTERRDGARAEGLIPVTLDELATEAGCPPLPFLQDVQPPPDLISAEQRQEFAAFSQGFWGHLPGIFSSPDSHEEALILAQDNRISPEALITYYLARHR